MSAARAGQRGLLVIHGCRQACTAQKARLNALFTIGMRWCMNVDDHCKRGGLCRAVALFRPAGPAAAFCRHGCRHSGPLALLGHDAGACVRIRHHTTPSRSASQPHCLPRAARPGGVCGGIQFIDGSFVENVEALANRDPSDIDVFSILSAPPRYLTDPAAWQATGLTFWNAEVANRDLNKQRFSLDTYAVLFEEIQARPINYINQIIYWYGLFSHQRDTFAWKGFAGLALDPAADQVALTALGGP